jgi:hypothetical protein
MPQFKNQNNSANSFPVLVLEEIYKTAAGNSTNVESRLQELTEEIRELRKMLSPPISVIITGQAAIKEFKNLIKV